MSDIRCAKCGEPWDAYGVRAGDMEPEESRRFLKGEGCPACDFGARCPQCDGTGHAHDHDYSRAQCPVCFDKGYTLAWSPRRNTGRYKAGEFYAGCEPRVLHVQDPGFDNPVTFGTRTFPEKKRYEWADTWVDEFWIPCPEGCVSRDFEPCRACEGTGKLKVAEDAAFKACKDEVSWSDEEPIEIMARRGF